MLEFFHEPENWVAVAFVIFCGVIVYVGGHRKVIDALDHRSARI
jgi:F-type H+-transporting ATPase subunit b